MPARSLPIEHFPQEEDAGCLAACVQMALEGIPPLVFIHTGQLSHWQEDTQHVILMSGYEGRDLWVNDPAFPEGPQRIQADELMLAWDEFDNIYATLTR